MYLEVRLISNTSSKTIALVNPNQLKPPISPVGLEYIAEVLSESGHDIIWIDLCFSDNWEETLKNYLSISNPDCIGISLRNIDEAMMGSQIFYVDFVNTVIQLCRQLSNAPIFLGGAGFSIAPCEILNYTGADFGFIGNGVNCITDFIEVMDRNTYKEFPGCIYRESTGNIHLNPPRGNLTNRYTSFQPHRNFADINKYFVEGGQIGIETKRGCSQQCIYCVESSSGHSAIELRNPSAVVFEIEQLVDKGINVFHWCDSEFNIHIEHALKICNELIKSGINKKIKWYTYCSPVPFTEELAFLMEEAGCVGINFGVDSLHNDILRLLHKPHKYEDIQQLIRILRKTHIAIMFDLLLGSPRENRETALFTIENAMKLKPDALGISFGVRLYPCTTLGKNVLSLHQKGINLNKFLYGIPIEENKNLLFPTYYLSDKLDKDFFDYLRKIVKDQSSVFLSLPSTEEGSYSYCNHDYLINAIKNGARGAYWDILRTRTLS
ncbi:MAG: B12-binding domain-containing radical SAM protein [Candidatus Hydrogenedens sp.]